MAYTTEKDTYGNTVVFEDGKRIATGTEEGVKSYYRTTGQPMQDKEASNSPTVPTFSPSTPAPEVPRKSYSQTFESEREAEIKRQEAGIKEIESRYANILDTELRTAGEINARDEKRSGVISSITGMAGGPDASTRLGNAEKRSTERNKQVSDRVAAQKAQEIGAIFGRIDENARKAAEIEYATSEADRERLRKDTATNALSNILSFTQQKKSDGSPVTWQDFSGAYNSDDTVRKEVERSGKNLFEVYELYTNAQPAPPKKEYAWRGDNLVVVQQDADGRVTTETFSTKDLGLPEEAKKMDLGTVTLGDGVFWFDKANPFKDDGTPNLTRLGVDPVTYRQQLGNGQEDSDVNSYANAVYGGSLKLASVPISLRGKVNNKVDELKKSASDRYETEFEARVDYDKDVNDLAKAVADGESLTAKPSEIIEQLFNDYGGKVSKQEIESTIYEILGVKK